MALLAEKKLFMLFSRGMPLRCRIQSVAMSSGIRTITCHSPYIDRIDPITEALSPKVRAYTAF